MDASLRTSSPSKTNMRVIRRAPGDAVPAAGGGVASTSLKSRGFLGLFFVVIFIMMYWVFLHRSLLHMEVQSKQSDSPIGDLSGAPKGTLSHPDPTHVKHLLDETKSLIRDVSRANLTLSKNILVDLEKIREERSNVHADLEHMETAHQEAKGELHSCNAVRLKATLKADELEKDLVNVKREFDAFKAMAAEVKSSSHCPECPKCEHSGSKEEEGLPVPQHVMINSEHDEHHHTRAQRWMTIGIPTVARAHNEDYLLRTLSALEQEFPSNPADLMYTQVRVLIVNIQGKGHRRFEEAMRKYGPGSSHPKTAYFEFITLTPAELASNDMVDPKEGTNDSNDKGNANHPGYRVRKQTRSIAMVMKKAMGTAKYFQFLEDDMLLCKGGLEAMHHMLSKATRYHNEWIALRASYGMNGIFLHDKDMEHFHQYLLKNQIRRPPDHLAVEWFAGETKESGSYRGKRINVAYRFNIYDHIGVSSTLRSQMQTSFPRCYESLGEPTLFQVEAFSPRQCPKDDIWPCKVANPEQMYVRYK